MRGLGWPVCTVTPSLSICSSRFISSGTERLAFARLSGLRTQTSVMNAVTHTSNVDRVCKRSKLVPLTLLQLPGTTPPMLGALRTVFGSAGTRRCRNKCMIMAASRSVGTNSAGSEELAVSCTAGGLGHVTLNRSKALNALHAELVERLHEQLLSWADPSAGVHAVLLDSALAPRSFCSGGDVRAARQAVLDAPYPDVPPEGHHVHRVFQAEYSLVCLVGDHPVPIISMCDGFWMGLGVGISVFGRYRVATDATVFAMPENAIGLWPDVGFALKAARCPGAVGLFLAVTGAQVKHPSDLLWAGIATHYVPSDKVEELRQALLQLPNATPDAIEAVLGSVCVTSLPEQGPLQCMQPIIDRVFGEALETAQEVDNSPTHTDAAAHAALAALHALHATLHKELTACAHGSEEFQLLSDASKALQQHSPASLAITLRHYAAVHQDVCSGGKLAQLPSLMQLEYAMAVRRVGSYDFCEGVRAALVDKDRATKWKPKGLTDVTAAEVEAVFAPLPGPGLTLPGM